MDKLKDLIDFQLYCDLDDVLCDFEKQFKKIGGGLTGNEYRHKYSKDEFRALIKSYGVEFWSEMPWMPDGKILWDFIKGYKAKILSAPMTNVPQSILGKKIWVAKNLGEDIDLILADGKDKPNYANNKSILIDDRKDTTDEWTRRGGFGIMHKTAAETVREVKRIDLELDSLYQNKLTPNGNTLSNWRK